MKASFRSLVIAIALWSTAEVVIRLIHTKIGPIQLAWVRFTVTTVSARAIATPSKGSGTTRSGTPQRCSSSTFDRPVPKNFAHR